MDSIKELAKDFTRVLKVVVAVLLVLACIPSGVWMLCDLAWNFAVLGVNPGILAAGFKLVSGALLVTTGTTAYLRICDFR